jgi:CheY-like chemotaxis protein
MRILLVDDNQQYREILADALRQFGHTVCTAGDGGQALDILEATGFDLVISDIEMPVLRGTELHALIRRDPRFRSIPFVYLSGHSDLRIAANACSDKRDSVLSKMTPVIEIIEIAKDLTTFSVN